MEGPGACGAWSMMISLDVCGRRARTRGRVAYLGFEKVMQTMQRSTQSISVGNGRLRSVRDAPLQP